MCKEVKPYILFLLVLFSCGQVNNTNSAKTTLKDSAIKSYLNHIDTLFKNDYDYYDLDSNEYSYKFLKAYYLNDTNYLKDIFKETDVREGDTLDSFWKRNIPILKRLNIEEGYQFQYSEAFCDYYYVITVIQSADSIELNTVIYRGSVNMNNKPTGIEVVTNYNKSLSADQWNELLDAIYFADYWNLKARNNEIIFDPNFLTVVGIKKDSATYKIEKTNSVTRTIFKRTALYKAFLLALKFAGIKKVCAR